MGKEEGKQEKVEKQRKENEVIGRGKCSATQV